MKLSVDEIRSQLETVIVKDRIAIDDQSRVRYGIDWTRVVQPNPSAIVFPTSIEEVVNLVNWARAAGVPLVPSGGRTGLAGGAVAAYGEVVVSFEKMVRIHDLDHDQQTIHCEAGATLQTVQERVAGKQLYLPIDLASRASCQIGGAVATNAGGLRAFRYGTMRQWVVGLKAVTGKGELLDLDRSLKKDVAGYDLKQVLIGSEGTLGLITHATLALTELPGPTRVVMLGTPTIGAAIDLFSTFRNVQRGLTAVEIFSASVLPFVGGKKSMPEPLAGNSPFYLLLECEAANEEQNARIFEAFEVGTHAGWIQEAVISDSPARAEALWQYREKIASAIAKTLPHKYDLSLMRALWPKFMEEVAAIFQRQLTNIEVVWFGHLGDGNLHVNLLKPPQMELAHFFQMCRAVDPKVFSLVQSFRGSVSGEHGIGLFRRSYLPFCRSVEEIQLMRRVKKSFDPEGILNPGKIFPPLKR